MIPIVCFYSKSTREYNSRFYKPSTEECRLIQKFVDAGIMPIVDSVNSCPDISHLTGLFWNETMDEMECISNYKDEPVTILVYFNEELSLYDLETAKEHLSNIIGLATFKRKGVVTRSMAKVETATKTYHHSGSEILSALYSANGRDIVARVEGGEREKEVCELVRKILESEACPVSS